MATQDYGNNGPTGEWNGQNNANYHSWGGTHYAWSNNAGSGPDNPDSSYDATYSRTSNGPGFYSLQYGPGLSFEGNSGQLGFNVEPVQAPASDAPTAESTGVSVIAM